jgi:hypothetical protein
MQHFTFTVNHAEALSKTREMECFLTSTREVFHSLTGIAIHGAVTAVHIVSFPVVFPLHVIGATTNILISTCTHVATHSVATVTSIVASPIDGIHILNSAKDNVLCHFSDAVPSVLHAVDGIKNCVGSIALGLFKPLLRTKQIEDQSSLSSSRDVDREALLERLRLDIPPCQKLTNEKIEFNSTPDFSKHLLRVDDLGVLSNRGKTFCFIDLCTDYFDEEISSRVFDALLLDGLALLSSGVDKGSTKFDGMIKWKPEGPTKRLLQSKERMKFNEWNILMEEQLLIWSGFFIGGQQLDVESPLFLSRGIVPGSPRVLFDLLCDSSRTTEYNRFCLGREDIRILEHQTNPLSNGREKIIKIVKSETRVPFTSLSVIMSTLMCAYELEGNELNDAFVIVSRSLVCGKAGNRCDCKGNESENKNEIIWGINLIRRVEGNPNLADIINLSQVKSSFVPRFLTHKVGIMAVEKSFQALRTRNGTQPA